MIHTQSDLELISSHLFSLDNLARGLCAGHRPNCDCGACRVKASISRTWLLSHDVVRAEQSRAHLGAPQRFAQATMQPQQAAAPAPPRRGRPSKKTQEAAAS